MIEDEKLSLLKDVTTIENPDSCIIFCRTQENVDHVYRQLKRANYPCDKIHGGMVQEDRFEVMDDFRKGKFRYLVATDVAEELILIILHMLLIMIFHLKSYVHRTGRTGRAGNSGKAITFITPYENRF